MGGFIHTQWDIVSSNSVNRKSVKEAQFESPAECIVFVSVMVRFHCVLSSFLPSSPSPSPLLSLPFFLSPSFSPLLPPPLLPLPSPSPPSPPLHSDLCTAYGKHLLTELQKNPSPNIMKLMQEGKRSRTKRTKTLCTWALKEMKSLQKWYVQLRNIAHDVGTCRLHSCIVMSIESK